MTGMCSSGGQYDLSVWKAWPGCLTQFMPWYHKWTASILASRKEKPHLGKHRKYQQENPHTLLTLEAFFLWCTDIMILQTDGKFVFPLDEQSSLSHIFIKPLLPSSLLSPPGLSNKKVPLQPTNPRHRDYDFQCWKAISHQKFVKGATL